MEPVFVGIDIAKDTFAVVVRGSGQNGKARIFNNNAKGIAALIHWLPDPAAAGPVYTCQEATGSYGQDVAEQLHTQGMRVSVVNPLATKRYAQSSLMRNQTDPVDAGMIAEFCENKKPRLWVPPTPAQKVLRGLSRRLEDLQKMLQMERNRLGASKHLPETVQTSLRQVMELLKDQIQTIKTQLRQQVNQDPELCRQKKLLISIKGVGELTAIRFLAELGDLRQFESAKQLAAYLGLTPTWKTSGTSVQTKPRLSKQGPAEVRQFLYMPAIVAKKHNPIIHAFCGRLALARKCDMSIIGAAMHKLVHLMYGVVHSGIPFDPDYFKNLQVAS
jgi:transposase